MKDRILEPCPYCGRDAVCKNFGYTDPFSGKAMVDIRIGCPSAFTALGDWGDDHKTCPVAPMICSKSCPGIDIADAWNMRAGGEREQPANPYPPILDATCGSRMIHFDKDCPDVCFMDCREIDGEAIWKGNSHSGVSVRHLNIHPDIVADFTAMPFPDATFRLVVFDPPHLHHIGENAWMAKKYGILRGNWKRMLQEGFRECMRVLKPGGTLIFKWSETQIPVGKVWEAIGERPIFGTRCGKSAKTIWATFWKTTEEEHGQ